MRWFILTWKAFGVICYLLMVGRTIWFLYQDNIPMATLDAVLALLVWTQIDPGSCKCSNVR